MGSPMITVVMCIYNEPEEWLKDSIESILNQTFTDLEFIIVNDNPDRALNTTLVNRYMEKDHRVRLLENGTNLGLTQSLNIAFKNANGEYIARMDADDISMTNRLETQFRYMECHPEVGVCGSWARYFGDIRFFSRKICEVPLTSSAIQSTLPFSNPMIHPTVFFRKSAIESFEQLYDEHFRSAQDYLLWEKLMSQKVNLVNLKKILLQYRVSSNQISSANKQNQNEVASIIRLRTLEKSGLYLSDQEKALLILLSTNRKDLHQSATLAQVELLLQKIRMFLIDLDSSNIGILNRSLFSEWLNCYFSFTFNWKNLALFFTSPLFNIRFLNPRDFVKILLSK